MNYISKKCIQNEDILGNRHCNHLTKWKFMILWDFSSSSTSHFNIWTSLTVQGVLLKDPLGCTFSWFDLKGFHIIQLCNSDANLRQIRWKQRISYMSVKKRKKSFDFSHCALVMNLGQVALTDCGTIAALKGDYFVSCNHGN